jgi:DNA repair protein RadC
MYPTPSSAPQQASLFPLPAGRPPRPYRVPIYRVQLVRDASLTLAQPQCRSSRDSAAMFRCYLGDALDREHFVVALLDTKNKLIGINTVSIGSLNASVVHPREVFKPAILANAHAILCAHNHPSGAPQPSQEDRVLTKRLVDAGKLLGINVLDHIILVRRESTK